MSAESTGEEMDSDLKEYLACFESDSGKQPKPKAASPDKAKVHKNYTKDLSFQYSQNSIENDAGTSLENLSLFSTASPHKKFNLKYVNDLETCHTISKDVVTPPSAKQDDGDTVSATGKLVLSLKDLGTSTSEDTALSISNSDIDDATTSSFNVNANVFTVDDLVAVGDSEATASKSTTGKYLVADKTMTDCKSTGVDDNEVKSYKDDFEEEEDSENTIVEESFVSESIEELVTSGTTASHANVSNNDNSTISSSPNVNKDSSISDTEEKQTSQHSSTLEDINTSVENNLSKHEVAIQTDPSWKVLNRLGAVNGAFSQEPDFIQCSEAETMALHNLVTQQLHLTRSLIDTARSLHHTQMLAIRPDYHYVTLEDTKQFIETHKPKVLKMKK